jgi:hypothetical protein
MAVINYQDPLRSIATLFVTNFRSVLIIHVVGLESLWGNKVSNESIVLPRETDELCCYVSDRETRFSATLSTTKSHMHCFRIRSSDVSSWKLVVRTIDSFQLYLRLVIILGAFAKLRKATVSFVMFVCLTVYPSAWKNPTLTGRILMKVDTWAFVENLSRKFKSRWNLTKITGTLREDLCTFMTASRWIHKKRKFSDKSCTGNQNTNFMFSNFFFFRTSFRLWANVEKYGWDSEVIDDSATRRMPFACWITKVTHINTQFTDFLEYGFFQVPVQLLRTAPYPQHTSKTITIKTRITENFCPSSFMHFQLFANYYSS